MSLSIVERQSRPNSQAVKLGWNRKEFANSPALLYTRGWKNQMNLDEATKQKVASWIEQGLKLSEIQSKLAAEFKVNLTYMETRLLVDDLKLTPKDHAPSKAPHELGAKPGAAKPADEPEMGGAPEEDIAAPSGAGGVSVGVDQVARPGALVSGTVSFSDGKSGAWYLDQMGRLGVIPSQQGYRPSPEDMQTFQAQLQNELAKLGF